jgi:peptidoglycan-associated lipoprotein
MERRLLRVILALLASAALSQGCALFGGSDEEDLGGNGGFGSEGNGGLGSGGGMSGSEFGGEGVAVAELETVLFDYDRALVREDQKPTLRSNARAIQNNGSWRTVVIEGHSDERGSEEYNLALGERRANAAKQYLVDSGIGSQRLDTVSFGESKPAVQGHDEDAWRWNRRAEFRVIR